VAFPPPNKFRLGFVREGGQGEPRIGEAHFLGVFREHVIGSLNQLALMLGDSLAPGFLDAASYNELVYLSHDCTVTPFFHNATLESGRAGYLKVF
jgi:hypothetical protein